MTSPKRDSAMLPPSVGRWVRWPFRWRTELPVVSLIVLGVFVVAAIFADVIAPFDPMETNLSNRLQPPVFDSGTWTHVLGTDGAGRDILSRLIFGARISLAIGVTALILGAVLGTAVGLVAGYFGGPLDTILMRLVDITISLPIFLLALLLAGRFGPTTLNVIIAVAFIMWSRFARVVRGEVLTLRERDYVALAKVAGSGPFGTMFRHILPNVFSTVVVLASLMLGWVLLVEASLSFLGAGVPPPEPAWGSMVALGREFITTAWWVPTMPGLAIMLAVLAMNVFGDWLRDRLDPTLRQL